MKELPPEYRFIWEDFLQLNSTRPSGFGVSPISYSEIKAYSELYGIDFEPWEVTLIKLFDAEAIRFYNEKQAKESAKK